MNNNFQTISNFHLQVIDKPKPNFEKKDFDSDLNEFNLKYYKTGFNYKKNKRYNNNNDFDNTKLNKIKKNIKDLKNEIIKLNNLVHRSQLKQNELYLAQNTFNNKQKYFGSKNNINKNLIRKEEKNNYIYSSAKKQKTIENNNFNFLYFSPDIRNIKKEKSKFNINKPYYNPISDNKNLSKINKYDLNLNDNRINLYKKKLEFNEINHNNIIKKEKKKKKINNKIEFNNQNVNHQIIIINNNNQKIHKEKKKDKNESKKNKKLEFNNDNKQKEIINKVTNVKNIAENKTREKEKEEEKIVIDNSLITDEELNIPLILETLNYNKNLIEKNIKNDKNIENIMEEKKEEEKIIQNNEIKNKNFKNKELKENNFDNIKEIKNGENIIQKEEENKEIKISETDLINKKNDKNQTLKENEEKLKLENNTTEDKKKDENNKTDEKNKIEDGKENNIISNNGIIKEKKEEKIQMKEEFKDKEDKNSIKNSLFNHDYSKDEENKIETESKVQLDNITIQIEESNKINEKEEEKNEINININNIPDKNDIINEQNEEKIIKEIISKIEKPKKSKKDLHIQINLDNNIIIGYCPKDLITDYAIIKDSPYLCEETFPLNHSFSLYKKILDKSPIPVSSIKNFEKKSIKIDKKYIWKENLEEKDIIPALYNENEEEIKNLEKSLEKSIDKSFDRSYEKSFDKSLNNLSVNESQNLSLSNNQSLSLNDGSFNASRNSLDGTSSKKIIQQLHRLFSSSFNKEIEEEKNSEKSQESDSNIIKDEDENDDNNSKEEGNGSENEDKEKGEESLSLENSNKEEVDEENEEIINDKINNST